MTPPQRFGNAFVPHIVALEERDGRLGYAWAEGDTAQWFCVDYLSSDFQRKLKSLKSSKDFLARAIGKNTKTVCDLNMGMAYDAYQLATSGFQVVAFERNKTIFRLVEDALKRAGNPSELKIQLADSLTVKVPEVDAYYLDPMYPVEKRSLPKKELRALRLLAGDDQDAEELFKRVWEQTGVGARVVVKRPDKSPFISKFAEPKSVLKGKTVRFDIYIKS